MEGNYEKKAIIQFIPQTNVDFILDGLNPPLPFDGHSSPPAEYYGPPPFSLPSDNYNHQQFSSGIPNHFKLFNDHKSNSQFSTTTHILPQYPSLSPQYLPPSKSILLPINQNNHKLHPSVQYGAPISNNFNPPPPSILPKPPKSLYGPPAPLFRSKPPTSNKNDFRRPNTKYEIKDHMVPPSVHISGQKNYQDIVGMMAPPVGNNNPHNIQDILHPPVSQFPILEEDFPPNTRKPLSSYGSPNIQGIEQVPLSSGDHYDLSYPIAFPNLSVRPVAPIHNFINFNQGIHGAEKVESIQVLPSVQLADYISSIEYPINVIQSPLVEVNSNGGSDITKLINISNQSTAFTPVYHSPTSNVIQSGLFVNPSINPEKLNEEPIIVEDAHVAASSLNETYKSAEGQRDGENDYLTGTQNSQALPLNGRENADDDSTIIENGISHSSDIIITNPQNNISSQKTEDNEILPQKNASKQSEFTQPPMDYSQWTPTRSGQSLKISPPPVQSTWITPSSSTEIPQKKTKHVQIIIPYYNFNRTTNSPYNSWNDKKNSHVFPFKSTYDTDSYTTLLPVFKPPSSTDKSVWLDFINDLGISSSERLPASPFQVQTTTKVYNIQDILGIQPAGQMSQKLPFDILSLQKNINEWTQQAYARTTEKLYSNQGVIQRLSPSKKIPREYFSTVPYDYTTTKPVSQISNDHVAAGSVKNENFKDDIGNNLVLEYYTTTTDQTTVPINIAENDIKPHFDSSRDHKSSWDNLQTTFSPVTKEKVYIVTPAPLKTTTSTPLAWSLPPQVKNGTVVVDKTLLFEHPKFSIRIEDNTTNSKGNGSNTTKVIYSEWPHKINNLQTSTMKPTSRHPLFGLMDVSVYDTPNLEEVEKIESKVFQTTTEIQRQQVENFQDEKKTS
ncbi:hypothetical protein WA026_009747 [Henosepilachna vigintioctopunctata]|uniref:Uncharacterized protein n=1 Tax=Henosepilachna vigintioctopunctata TaxID=420089 RepID=A0AAW1TR34_9CUCU